MIAPALRRLLFVSAFVTAVVSAAFLPGEESAPKRSAKSRATPGAAPQEPRMKAREVEVPALLAYRRSMEEGVEVVDIFAPRLPPGAAGPAAKPVPPKLPFAFVGLIEESGRAKAVLAQGDQMYIVSKGEQFGGSYRLEEVGSNEIVVVYLPLGARQSLPTGAPQ